MSFDPLAFRSDRLPTGHFDERFSEENVAFWVPILVKAARIEPGLEVLDLGCGTGGFARAMARSAPTQVTGYDRSERFIGFANQLPGLPAGTVRWVVGDAEQLPFGSSCLIASCSPSCSISSPRFAHVVTERYLRNKMLVLADEERALLVEARSRYAFLTSDELDEGVQRMRADAASFDWIDPRPTYVLVGTKPPPEGRRTRVLG